MCAAVLTMGLLLVAQAGCDQADKNQNAEEQINEIEMGIRDVLREHIQMNLGEEQINKIEVGIRDVLNKCLLGEEPEADIRDALREHLQNYCGTRAKKNEAAVKTFMSKYGHFISEETKEEFESRLTAECGVYWFGFSSRTASGVKRLRAIAEEARSRQEESLIKNESEPQSSDCETEP